MDGIVDLARTRNVVRGADIICLQEVDQFWRRSGYCDQAAEIAGLMPTHFYVYGASFDVDASSRAAHGAVVNRRRRHGNMILSRWPILSSRCFNLPKWHYEDRFNMRMTCLEAVIDAGGLPMRVYNYHGGYLDADERLAQVDEFAALFQRAADEHGAWSGKADIDGDDWSDARTMPPMPGAAIVCGDFNAAPDDAEYRRLLQATGLVDCWARVDPDNRLNSTLLKEPGTDVRITGKVDHILVTPELAERLVRVDIVDEALASDHRPVQAILDLPG
jgi:endonuclease/exonuclease/phosphatase family metal-dependent hydrolase